MTKKILTRIYRHLMNVGDNAVAELYPASLDERGPSNANPRVGRQACQIAYAAAEAACAADEVRRYTLYDAIERAAKYSTIALYYLNNRS